MAEQIYKEPVLANFKPSRTKRLEDKRQKPAKKRAARPGNSLEHLDAIRKLPCVVTLKEPAGEAHHLKFGTNERGAGMRSTDKFALPLCRAAHESVERVGARNEPGWFRSHGIEAPLDLALALWKASPNITAMRKIIIANHKKKV